MPENDATNVMVANLAKAIKVIKQAVPTEEKETVNYLLAAFNEISNYQNEVRELKEVHHMLHELETVLGIFLLHFKGAERPGRRVVKLDVINETWRQAIWPQIYIMRHFAEFEMKFLKPPFLESQTNGVSGPRWIVEILVISDHIRLSLNEKSVEEVFTLSHQILDTCREQMYYVDRQLLTAIDRLDRLTYQIMRGLGHVENPA